MNLKSIKSARVYKKNVLLRVDFNISIENGKIEDDFRIKRSLKTIKYLLDKKAKVILITHLGRPKGEIVPDLSTRVFVQYLSRLLNRKVHFVPDCIGEGVKQAINKLNFPDVILLENLRFYKEEEENDNFFAAKLASLADVYINDAFSVSHRAHASVFAVTKYLPSYAGFLILDEVSHLEMTYKNPKRPFVVAIGGAKLPTKVRLVKRFLTKADHILLGGVVANLLLDAKGIAIGKSKIDKSVENEIKEINMTLPQLHLPLDVVVAKEASDKAKTKVVAVGSVEDDDIILDIGPYTVDLFSKIVSNAKMVVWNGPFGYFELENFSHGTYRFADALSKSSAFKIIGGGESIEAVKKAGDLGNINFVSTGGGAMLSFLAGERMPGLEVLERKPFSLIRCLNCK